MKTRPAKNPQMRDWALTPACQGNTCDVQAVFSQRSLMLSTSCLKSPVRLLKLSVPSEQPVSLSRLIHTEQGDEGPSVVWPPRRGSFLAVLLFVQTCDTFHSPQALAATSLMNVSLAPQGLCCISLRLNASGPAPPPTSRLRRGGRVTARTRLRVSLGGQEWR